MAHGIRKRPSKVQGRLIIQKTKYNINNIIIIIIITTITIVIIIIITTINKLYY